MPQPFESEEQIKEREWQEKAKEGKLSPITCMSTWMDICGFGSQLENNEWDITKMQTSGMINLLNQVYSFFAGPILARPDPEPNEKVLIINDGIARTIDLINQHVLSASEIIFYFRNLFINHYNFIRITGQNNLGGRTIISGGERIQYSPTNITGHSVLYYSKNPSEWGQRLLDTNFLYNPSEFQMNTAFAKSYSIDSVGTRGGFNINGFYIENSVFDKLDRIPEFEFIKEKDSILLQINGETMLEYVIRKKINFDFKGLATVVFDIKLMRVDESIEGEEVIFDLESV